MILPLWSGSRLRITFLYRWGPEFDRASSNQWSRYHNRSNTGPNRDPNTGTHRHTNATTNGYPNSDGHANADRDTNTSANGVPDADANQGVPAD